MNTISESSGLSEAEAAARLAAEGANEIPAADRRNLFGIVRDVVREPMFALLLGAAVIYLLLGDLGEATLLTIFATLSVVVSIVQESRSEHVLEALRDLSSPRALVIREGARRRIPGREVVRGDVIVIAEGDRVPADARLIFGADVQIDESLLTGESVPVRKSVATSPVAGKIKPGGDDSPYLYSGSLVVRGHGLAEVFATGPRTEMGRIGRALGGIEREQPLLRRQTQPLVKLLAIAGLSLSLIIVVLYGWLRGAWLDGLLAGIALSMSLLPEELPLVLTVFLAMGAWRISQARVLTRRAAAIEMLGAATVLCADKTGTLTENLMSVAELRIGTETLDPSKKSTIAPHFQELIEYGILAAVPDPFDPMEKAIHSLADRLDAGRRHRDWILVKSYMPRPGLPAMVQLWQKDGDPNHWTVAVKGAPETVGTACRLDDARTLGLRNAVNEMAANGIRVLAVARATLPAGTFPDLPLASTTLELIGLIGFADPIRSTVPPAVRECQSAGVRVVMITGDYPTTAQAIAAQAGLVKGATLTGDELDALNDSQLAQRARETMAFARITPEQKLRIVDSFKRNGDVVAMTGDGTNDAPSLKSAHIGIAMGGRGTDVAREAAALVLLDDDFRSIVRAMRLGRRIYDNLRKAIGYVFAVHVPIAGLALLPLIFGWPLIFAPIHIAFLEMVIDPVCSVVFEAEAEEADVMKRPPRSRTAPLISPALALWSAFQGVIVLLLVLTIYLTALGRGLPDGDVRALTFVSLVFTNIGLIFVNRSFSASLLAALRRPNALLWLMIGTIGVLLLLIFSWPTAQTLFRLGSVEPTGLAICVAAGIAVVVVLDAIKPKIFSRLT